MNDSHCHFFSERFFVGLGRSLPDTSPDAAEQTALDRLGWEAPGTPEQLADRWASELDLHNVIRAALIASVPGDDEAVARAVRRHPARFVGFFMVDPTVPEAAVQAGTALDRGGLRVICLFPALHGYSLHDPRVRALFEVAAARTGTAIFVHCGVLSIGVRKKLDLPSAFDLRLGDPLGVARVAARFRRVPVIIPHFGAGLFREALMAADQCPNIHFDTSSSNSWMRYHPHLTLDAVFRQALEVLGPERLLFGTDSSFFPSGWQRPLYDAQLRALDAIGVDAASRAKILGGNFDRLFPVQG